MLIMVNTMPMYFDVVKQREIPTHGLTTATRLAQTYSSKSLSEIFKASLNATAFNIPRHPLLTSRGHVPSTL